MSGRETKRNTVQIAQTKVTAPSSHTLSLILASLAFCCNGIGSLGDSEGSKAFKLLLTRATQDHYQNSANHHQHKCNVHDSGDVLN